MLDALDHVVVAGGPAVYETLLGRRAVDGRLQTGNVGLTFDPAAAAPLAALVFATGDLDAAARRLERRSVAGRRDGATLELDPAATHGVPIALVERRAPPAASPLTVEAPAAVAALDHVVVRTPDPERAVALYAGRLGLDLRLDRSNPAWGSRLLFFRCGDLVVEVAHDLAAGVSAGPDRPWGLSWRVPDPAAAQARLRTAGVAVSEVRAGRRPGSQVFTVKDGSAGVPTLMIGGIGRW